MDVMKENTVILHDRGGLKNNSVPPSASKRQQCALLDVRNTVQKKRLDEPSLSKQFLEVNDAKVELGTPSPSRKLTPFVKRPESEVDVRSEDLEDYRWTYCPCNFNDRMFEDDYLPERCQFTEADIDNLAKIWYGQGGRDDEEKFVLSPLKIERKTIDWDALRVKPDLIKIPFNDSGIDLDIEIELE